MKKLMLWLVAMAVAFPGSALLAQNITGTWQGTLEAGKPLRIVIKISTTDADSLKAVLYSIDQGAPGLPANAVTRQGATVKMSVPAIGGDYEGKVSADGNSITGTWTQGPKPLPLNLARATAETAWAIPEAPPPVKKMAADADPGFEVATIKPTKPGEGMSILVRGRQFTTTDTSLSDLIAFAYGIHAKQISGGPAWLETEKFDVTGEPDKEGQPSVAQLRTMIQKLLTDRFKLTFHRDRKELSAYALVVGKTAPKLTKSERDPNGLPGLGFRGAPGKFAANNANMVDFAGFMQGIVLDRPVVDQTGISGRYDFTLNWQPDQSQFGGRFGQIPPPADDAEALPDLFTAIQQQLGLKLEAGKTPVDVIVIDKVEKPSEN